MITKKELTRDVEVGPSSDRPYILVAEDNPANQELMAAQLTLLGYTAKFADNGVEALKLWKTAEFQLLLTDIRMPEMDGYELIKAIRRIKPDGDTLPIIAVTANALKTDIEKCLETGADDVLPKPFGLEALKQMLEKWV